MLLALGSATVGLTGCGGVQVAKNTWNYNATWNGFVMKHRNQGMATKAWHLRKHGYCNEACLDQFCDGFEAGYLAVAEGGDPCTPAFAPREYWGWEYQSAEGQRKVASWLAGYPHGCRAAEEDGIGNWSQIQTSYAIQDEYHQAGLLAENQRPGMYPMPEALPAGQFAAQRAMQMPPSQNALEAVGPEGIAPEPVMSSPSDITLPLDTNTPPTLQQPAEAPVIDHSSLTPGSSRLVR
jgi:hypothetical protein